MQRRRAFLSSGLGLTGSLLVGCGDEADIEQGSDAATTTCRAGLEGGEMLGLEPFVGEDSAPYEVPLNAGLDGRLYSDLRRVEGDHLITPNDAFYIRTRAPDQLDLSAPWTISLRDRTGEGSELELDTLRAHELPMGTFVLECSGNSRGAGFGLLSSAEWSGVRLLDILEQFGLTDAASRILVKGFDEHSQPSANNHSTPGASWIFSFEDLANTGAFLATRMNGSELPLDHGWPVRLFVPGWYGCTCIKWVNAIELVNDDAPATSQMLEFASRTHQNDAHPLARDYAPANLEVAAMPTRIERWRIGDRVVHRMLGIVWGGAEPVNHFEAQIGGGMWRRVTMCTERTSTASWSIWDYVFSATPGTYEVRMRAADASVPQRRLDSDYYLRRFEVTG